MVVLTINCIIKYKILLCLNDFVQRCLQSFHYHSNQIQLYESLKNLIAILANERSGSCVFGDHLKMRVARCGDFYHRFICVLFVYTVLSFDDRAIHLRVINNLCLRRARACGS